MGIAVCAAAAANREGTLYLIGKVCQPDCHACSTSQQAVDRAPGGKPGAASLSGLARAFFYAGAKALMVSHWSVQTTMAARLTSETVRAQQRDPSLTKPQALRQAMLAVLDDRWLPSQYRHPAFWAPFFIVGD